MTRHNLLSQIIRNVYLVLPHLLQRPQPLLQRPQPPPQQAQPASVLLLPRLVHVQHLPQVLGNSDLQESISPALTSAAILLERALQVLLGRLLHNTTAPMAQAK